jgi:hypothetical protein
MSAASTDRLVTAHKVRKHNGRLLCRIRKIRHDRHYLVERVNEAADERVKYHLQLAKLRVESAQDDRNCAERRLTSLLVAQPLLDPFQRTWCGKGFFRRVWNAVRYVFIGEAVWHG